MNCDARFGNQTPTFQVVGDYASSSGAKLVELFERHGVTFYPSQKHELELFAARDNNGRFASKTIAIVKPRQNGKSYSTRYYATGMAAAGKHVLYSAHNNSTSHEMYKNIEDFVTSHRDFEKRLKKVGGLYRAPGKEGVYFKNGGVIRFQTRTNSGLRGLTYDVVIVDEAQELTYDQLDAMKPTTIASASGDPQMIYLGTPPGPNCRGEVFADMHKAAHEGNAGGAWWVEWSVPNVPDLTDRSAVLELAYMTNPAMGYRIKEDVMLDAIDQYQNRPDSFAREYLGWWSPLQKTVAAINIADWQKCETSTPPKSGRLAFAVKFTIDGQYAAIGVCRIPDEGVPHVELVRYVDLALDGLDSVAQFVYQRQDKATLTIIDGKAASDDLAARLEYFGMSRKAYKIASSRDYVGAASMLVNSVREHGLTHFGQSQLTDAIKTTTKRAVGNAGGYGFTGDFAEVLDSVALALYAARTSKRVAERGTMIW